jgi:curli biogenesis system outer membrane secretion channel CsgG
MKAYKIFPSCAVGLAILAGAFSVRIHPQTPPARKTRIAIMDFDYATVQSSTSAMFGTNVDVGKGISDLLVTDLVKDGTYSIIERAALDKILKEQNFSKSRGPHQRSPDWQDAWR